MGPPAVQENISPPQLCCLLLRLLCCSVAVAVAVVGETIYGTPYPKIFKLLTRSIFQRRHCCRHLQSSCCRVFGLSNAIQVMWYLMFSTVLFCRRAPQVRVANLQADQWKKEAETLRARLQKEPGGTTRSPLRQSTGSTGQGRTSLENRQVTFMIPILPLIFFFGRICWGLMFFSGDFI